MMLRTVTLAAALALYAATPSGARAAPMADARPAPPWYLDPEEIGPLTAPEDAATRPLHAYAGDEDAGDFADRYGCRPVWDGGINAYVPACTTR